MVRLKIAYWEFDFEAVCPTLDHDLLSQAHMQVGQTLLLPVSTPLQYSVLGPFELIFTDSPY